MEAPEKIHIQPNAHDGWFEGSIPSGLPDGLFVEYTRTDVFIDKVINFLEILGYGYTITDNITKSLYDNTQLIEDFKKYMEE